MADGGHKSALYIISGVGTRLVVLNPCLLYTKLQLLAFKFLCKSVMDWSAVGELRAPIHTLMLYSVTA
jgi:hypothetical protein